MGRASEDVSHHSSRSYRARLARYGTVSTALALLSDRRLSELVEEAARIGSGIGGTAALLVIEGTPVFAKAIPLTDLERRPEHILSTANLFQLPPYFQYGVGSAGFGVWRELAAHVMTTNWVLGKHCESFPLLYHWRVLEAPPVDAPAPERPAELARTVAYWHGSPAVRERLEAIARSSARVVLFLEYLPQSLHEWLTAQVASGDEAVESACALVEHELRRGIAFMHARGLLHFDAHFRNILTDGRHLYFADFGLATSSRFELSEAERTFLALHRGHDGCYTVTQLVNWLVTAFSEVGGWAERNAYIRRCAEGEVPLHGPPAAVALITRYAPIASVMNEFYRQLHLESRTTAYPVDVLDRVCAAIGFTPGGRHTRHTDGERP
jgi:Protein kinase domain